MGKVPIFLLIPGCFVAYGGGLAARFFFFSAISGHFFSSRHGTAEVNTALEILAGTGHFSGRRPC